jgi:protoheme IX farnesyltransferase
MARATSLLAVAAPPRAHVAWRDLLGLTRPRVTLVAAITGWPALTLGPETPAPAVLAGVLAGLVLLASGCSAVNAWLERDRDRLMTRTRKRPLPAGRVSPRAALAFAVTLSAAGVAVLALCGTAAAAAIGLATWAAYVGPYTSWAKSNTAWSAVVGAFPGAAAPLIAGAAVNGQPGFYGWTLFAVVFLWQAPHVWAIELFRGREYAAAGLPTMPARAGAIATRRLMLAWTVALVGVTLLPWIAGRLGLLYGVTAIAANLCLLRAVAIAIRTGQSRDDRQAFVASLLHVTAVFGAMIVEPMLR